MSFFHALGLNTTVPYHFLACSFAIGGPAFYGFVAAPILFKTLPRSEFRRVLSEVFPKYFFTQTVAPIVLRLLSPFKVCPVSTALLVASSVSGAINYFWLLNTCRSLSNQRKALEDSGADVDSNGEATPEYATLTKQFGKYHGISTLSNMVLLLTIALYGVFVSRSLVRMR